MQRRALPVSNSPTLAAAIICLLVLLPHSSLAAELTRHVLQGHLPDWATSESDQGAAAPDLQLNNLAVVLKRSDKQEAAFRQFLQRQQNPHSSDYHQWLTAREIGERFGPSSHAIGMVTNWLEFAGLRVEGVSNSRMFVQFSGSAGLVSRAFGADIRYYQIPASKNGSRLTNRLTRPLLSIGSNPAIPASLAHLVAAISGLSEVPANPGAHGRALPKTALPRYTSCSAGNCQHYIAPADFATIFDVNPVYNAGAYILVSIVNSYYRDKHAPSGTCHQQRIQKCRQTTRKNETVLGSVS